MRLKDKVTVITGAASGIGKEIARTFVREGAKVVIADLNQAGANTVAGGLGGIGNAVGVGMDVIDEAQVEAGMAAAANAFGRIDILISNAGVQTVAPLAEGNRRRRVHHGRGRRRDSSLSGSFRFKRADGPIARRFSWLVHAMSCVCSESKNPKLRDRRPDAARHVKCHPGHDHDADILDGPMQHRNVGRALQSPDHTVEATDNSDQDSTTSLGTFHSAT